MPQSAALLGAIRRLASTSMRLSDGVLIGLVLSPAVVIASVALLSGIRGTAGVILLVSGAFSGVGLLVAAAAIVRRAIEISRSPQKISRSFALAIAASVSLGAFALASLGYLTSVMIWDAAGLPRLRFLQVMMALAAVVAFVLLVVARRLEPVQEREQRPRPRQPDILRMIGTE
jgi:formate-dependent nitrite reductase membrane component NrfD